MSLRDFIRANSTWEDIKATFYFYRWNLHSIPGISQLMCAMGRHDYELDKVISNTYVHLKCFYCEHGKGSSHTPSTT